MKTLITLIITSILSFLVSQVQANPSLKKDFKIGDPGIASIHKMTFGPAGILFIGDSKAAQVVAIDFSEHPTLDNSKVKLDNLDKLISDMMGTTIDQIQITDMAVNPANNNIYLSINHSSGVPILLRVEDNVLKQVPLDNVSFSKTTLLDPISEEAKDKRGRKLRKWAVADIKYIDGKLLLSGLSNKEFASTFRSIDFPFGDTQDYSSLEIYHAAHGKYETHAPIKTFIPTTINGKSQVLAGYTCTPLVIFPMNKIKSGEHHKGRTVAELGSGNSPIDMIEIENEGNRYLLIANSNRALMKMDFKDLEAYQGSLTKPVVKKGAAEGVEYVNLPYVNVQQLDRMGDNGFIIIQRESSGNLALKTGNSWWVK
ncbi:hypothetical protein SAMN04487910_0688 [Aquimarina amphilecti]|uniref:Uncharacterized protein n=1 Tax=Aquimarina amphilecti TaxID=1038014 RepID=A0A1H7HKV1_AQUAM|nr:hypothetical protein [Aquimarina amphilecti]SEK50881.1 hypothetical protein SAMN04487910_0688 [Aquimarina amphilecti]